jgi:putative ATPase
VFDALDIVQNQETMPVPLHLQDSHYKGAAKLGHGLGYLYAHDYPGNYVKQQYLPDKMEGMTFYHPTENGYERKIKEHLKELKK